MPCDCPPPLQLTSLSDRYVSHFETDGPHVLLYFDSVSVERRRGSSCVSILPRQGRRCGHLVREEVETWLGGREPWRAHLSCLTSMPGWGCEFSWAVISLQGFMGSHGEVGATVDTGAGAGLPTPAFLGKERCQVRQVGWEANPRGGSHRECVPIVRLRRGPRAPKTGTRSPWWQ